MDPGAALAISAFLIVVSAFFVSAEYALVASRRSRIESMAQKGSRSAKLLIQALDQTSRYVAGIQVGITLTGLGMGALTEPFIASLLEQSFGEAIPPAARTAVALLIGTFFLVVLGELVPKYLTLKHPEQLAIRQIQVLRIFVALLGPLAWLSQTVAAFALRPLGVDPNQLRDTSFSREELAMLVRAGEDEGILEESHADVVTRALRFDKLDAADIMIHRLDIKWIDVESTRTEILTQCSTIPHSRVLVCRGDIDDVLGVLYVRDLLKPVSEEEFDLNRLVRPIEVVPENLTLNRIVNRMREARTQILLVIDEYGGTSGLITLEDVVEEVFGEIEDQLESERAPIERPAPHRLSARADVRYDEILEFLELPPEDEPSTDTLASMLVQTLERMPALGDQVSSPIGLLVVENMARRRITRVRLILNDEIVARSASPHSTSEATT